MRRKNAGWLRRCTSFVMFGFAFTDVGLLEGSWRDLFAVRVVRVGRRSRRSTKRDDAASGIQQIMVWRRCRSANKEWSVRGADV